MSRDPDGRVNRCERCGVATELHYNEHHDEYWCADCIDNENEAAWHVGRASEGAQTMTQYNENNISALRAKVDELTAALKPFAEIALCQDFDPAAADMLDMPDFAIVPNDVRTARVALALNSQHSRSGGVHFPGRDPTFGEII